MKINEILKSLTAHVRRTKGAGEALDFFVKHIQPLTEYFGGEEESKKIEIPIKIDGVKYLIKKDILKNLTTKQCEMIATIAKPEIEWMFTISDCKWDGFDLIEKSAENRKSARYIFQIDFRSETELIGKPRIRFYEKLKEIPLSIEKRLAITEYLSTL